MKQKWTNKDTANSVDFALKLQQLTIDGHKASAILISEKLALDSTNVELQQQLAHKEAVIAKLEARLQRSMVELPKLVNA